MVAHSVGVQTDVLCIVSSGCQAGDGKYEDRMAELFASERRKVMNEVRLRSKQLDYREREILERESKYCHFEANKTKLIECETTISDLRNQNEKILTECESLKTENSHMHNNLDQMKRKFTFYSTIIHKMTE